jgi:hypothetical protein
MQNFYLKISLRISKVVIIGNMGVGIERPLYS